MEDPCSLARGFWDLTTKHTEVMMIIRINSSTSTSKNSISSLLTSLGRDYLCLCGRYHVGSQQWSWPSPPNLSNTASVCLSGSINTKKYSHYDFIILSMCIKIVSWTTKSKWKNLFVWAGQEFGRGYPFGRWSVWNLFENYHYFCKCVVNIYLNQNRFCLDPKQVLKQYSMMLATRTSWFKFPGNAWTENIR